MYNIFQFPQLRYKYLHLELVHLNKAHPFYFVIVPIHKQKSLYLYRVT